MESVKKIEFKANLVLERSITPVVEQLGEYDSSMELYTQDGTLAPGCGTIEWDNTRGEGDDYDEIVEHIGVWWNANKELTEYDGVFSLPAEAIQLLEEVGITVGDDFRS